MSKAKIHYYNYKYTFCDWLDDNERRFNAFAFWFLSFFFCLYLAIGLYIKYFK